MPEYATKTERTGEYFTLHENASDAVVAAWLHDAAGRNHQSWPKDKIGPFLTSKLGCKTKPYGSKLNQVKRIIFDFSLVFRKMAESIPAPPPRTTRKNSCDSVIQMTF